MMKIEHLSVLATVVVAFAASTALILNGQSELRRDMLAGQAEIRKDLKSLEVRLAVVEQRRSGRSSERAVPAGEAPAPDRRAFPAVRRPPRRAETRPHRPGWPAGSRPLPNKGMGRRRKGAPPRGTGRPRADSRVDRWLRGAFDAHRAQNLREAEKLAWRVLDAVPEQPDALHLLATVARESGRADLAIDLYRRLLRRHPAIPTAHNSLGNMLQEREEWQEAIACYHAALVHDPHYASAYFNLGRALLHVNDLVRAEHCLRQAAALAPNDASIRSRLARALVESGKEEEAVAVTDRSVELDPDSAEIHNDAGAVHSTIGDFDTARAYFCATLALDPGHAKAALNLAKTKRFTAARDEDEDRIRTAAALGAADDATQRNLHLALGKIHDDRGEWEAAFAHYEQANRPFTEPAARQVDDSLALMDRMRAVFDADWLAARLPAPDPDPTPVFIVGMPRSGTSLVEQCLAAHPAVHGAGELSAILRLAMEAASRAGAVVDPLRTGVMSIKAAGRPGAEASYPECVRTLPAAQVAALGKRYLDQLRTSPPERRGSPTSSRATTCTSASSPPSFRERRSSTAGATRSTTRSLSTSPTSWAGTSTPTTCTP